MVLLLLQSCSKIFAKTRSESVEITFAHRRIRRGKKVFFKDFAMMLQKSILEMEKIQTLGGQCIDLFDSVGSKNQNHRKSVGKYLL